MESYHRIHHNPLHKVDIEMLPPYRTMYNSHPEIKNELHRSIIERKLDSFK